MLEPSKVGELPQFCLWVKKIGGSSLMLAVEAKAGAEVRVRATLIVVQASLETRRAVPFSPDLREKLARFLA